MDGNTLNILSHPQCHLNAEIVLLLLDLLHNSS